MQQRSSGATAAGAIAVVGGALAVIGSFLSWANASAGQFTVSAKGIDGWEGKATIIGGALLLIGGIKVLSKGSTVQLKRLGLLGGAVVAGVGIYTAVTAKDQVIEGAASEIAKQLGVSLDQARAAVHQAIDAGDLKIALGVGLFVVIAAGVAGIVAGVLALISKTSAPPMPAAGGVAGLTGWAAPGAVPAPPGASPGAPAPAPAPAEPAPSPWAVPDSPYETPPSDPGGGPATT